MYILADRVSAVAALSLAQAGASSVDAHWRCTPAYGAVLALRAQADAAVAASAMPAANRLLDKALRLLGTGYYTTAMIDDTDLKLGAALSDERRGRLNKAANIRRRVLTERIALCGRT